MRVIAVSLLAGPALVAALFTPVRRAFSGFATFYYTQTGNAGSCGDYLQDTDFTVAVNSGQYNGDMCHKLINIRAFGKSTQARVMDQCPEGGGNCHWGDLDMSPSLFQFFAGDLGVGKFPMEWEFADEGAPAPEPQPTTTYVDSPPYSQPVENLPAPTVDTTYVEYVAPTTTTSVYVEEQAVPTTSTTEYVQPDTTTSTSSAETTTSTPTFGEKLYQAMAGYDMSGLGEAFVELGNAMIGATADPTTTPAY